MRYDLHRVVVRKPLHGFVRTVLKLRKKIVFSYNGPTSMRLGAALPNPDDFPLATFDQLMNVKIIWVKSNPSIARYMIDSDS